MPIELAWCQPDIVDRWEYNLNVQGRGWRDYNHALPNPQPYPVPDHVDPSWNCWSLVVPRRQDPWAVRLVAIDSGGETSAWSNTRYVGDRYVPEVDAMAGLAFCLIVLALFGHRRMRRWTRR